MTPRAATIEAGAPAEYVLIDGVCGYRERRLHPIPASIEHGRDELRAAREMSRVERDPRRLTRPVPRATIFLPKPQPRAIVARRSRREIAL